MIDEAAAHWPGWPKPLHHRAYHSYVGGDIPAALDDYREMARLAPEYYKAWSAYGGLLTWEGRYEEGIEACENALALRRDDGTFSNLATAYFEEAARTYQNALQSGRSDYRIWLNLGDACSMFDVEQAQSAYEQAIRVAQEDVPEDVPDPTADLARLYVVTGQPADAQEHLDQALGFAELRADELESCALAAWGLGQRELALDLLERAIEAGALRKWLRDSALNDEWREDPGFAVVLKDEAI